MAGQVVTVEPGIYLIDSLLAVAHADSRREYIDWAVVEELKPFGGIRVEDNKIEISTRILEVNPDLAGGGSGGHRAESVNIVIVI